MKALLICPAFRPAVGQLAEAAPLAAVPIFGGCLVNHWIEYLAAQGARDLRIIAADRPAQIKAAIGDGRRWGVRIEVIAVAAETTRAEAAASYQPAGETGWLPAPHDIVVMSHLPGAVDLPLFESYAGWFSALQAWMPRALTPARVCVREIQPGVWVGRRARVSSDARLVAPCWIGDQVLVGPGVVVGPATIVEDRAVLEAGARVVQSHVGPDTLVGRMVAVTNSLAQGSMLINWQTESSLLVPDPFLLSSLARPKSAPAPRALAAMAEFAGAPFSTIAAWLSAPSARRISNFR